MRRFACLAFLPLLACVSSPDTPGPTASAGSLNCIGSGALSADVIFERSDAATLFVQGAAPGTIIVLPQAPAGSGFLYTDGNATLRGQGAEAMLTLGGESLTCSAA